MRVSESVHSVKIPFRLPAGGGGHIERSVNAFLVTGREACLVDAGVAASTGSLLAMVRGAGRESDEVSVLVLTHSHPDHMGGAMSIREVTGCIVAAHPAEVAWIEDPSLQARERPIPGFSTLVGGPVRVDRLLGDDDRIGIGEGRSLSVIHTPGHSPGSISLFLKGEGVLISGDAIPVKGEVPVYDDPVASVRSIGKLEEFPGVKILLSSWDSQKTGRGIGRALADGREVIRTLHGSVVRATGMERNLEAITRFVVKDLGLPEAALPVISRTVAGHIRRAEQGVKVL